MNSTPSTAVIFRTFKKDGDVIALFPLEPSDRSGFNCESYLHIGQHGGATPGIVNGKTRPSTRAEIAPLRKELIRIGYRLKELRRFPSNAYQVRKEKAKR